MVPLPYGGVRGGFPSFWEGLGVGSLHTAGNSKAGSDGGQYGRNGLNDKLPSILFHVVH